MPVNKVPGGYRWGSTGKIYPTRAEAERQGQAIHAAGYGKKKKAQKQKPRKPKMKPKKNKY